MDAAGADARLRVMPAQSAGAARLAIAPYPQDLETVARLRDGTALRVLMMRLIDIARRRGIGELAGKVLRENVPMLQMCRALDFTITPEPADPAVMLVRKRLAA